MQCTNFFKAIPLSFFSADFYREVSKFWRLRSFLYLLILLLICWIFIAFTQTKTINRIINIELANIYQQMPDIYFHNGLASVKQLKPTIIKWTGSDDILAIIDTHNTYHNFTKTQANILVGKQDIFIRISPDKVTSYPYPKNFSGLFGPEQLTKVIAKIKKKLVSIIYVAIYILGLFLSYVYHILLALVYGLIGLLFCVILKRKLSYAALFNLAIFVMTPAIVLDTLLMLFNLTFRWDAWVYIVISVLYLFFVVKAIAPKKTPAQAG